MTISTIYWVFGGTCVGKKHFIRHAVEHPAAMGFHNGIEKAAYNDGVTDATALREQSQHGPIIVRWQWGRESAIENLAKEYPLVHQEIFLLKVYPSVQVARMLKREGHPKFDERNLMREAEEVDFLVQRLSTQHNIPVRFIDASREYPT